MKVECSLCGEKFDLEKNNGVCPSCACHYHVDGEEERRFEGYGPAKSYKPTEDPPDLRFAGADYGKEVTAITDDKAKNGCGCFFLIMMLSVCLFFAFLIPVGLYIIKETKNPESFIRFSSDRQVYNPEEGYTIELDSLDYTIRNIKVEPGMDWNFSNEYLVVSVFYEATKTSDDDIPIGDSYLVNMTLGTHSGMFLMPFNSSVKERTDNYSSGAVSFLVRGYDADCLVINLFDGDREAEIYTGTVYLDLEVVIQ